MSPQPELTPTPQVHPIIAKTSQALKADQEYRQAQEAFEARVHTAQKAGLPLPTDAPALTESAVLGAHLQKVFLTSSTLFRNAINSQIDPEGKSHSLLETALASLGSITDPLERSISVNAAANEILDRANNLPTQFSDLQTLLNLAPELSTVPGGLATRVLRTISDRLGLGSQNAWTSLSESVTPILDQISTNTEYLPPETIYQANLLLGELIGRRIDSAIRPQEAKIRYGQVPTLTGTDLRSWLSLQGDFSQEIGRDPECSTVPALIARLSRSDKIPDITTRQRLQGVVLGLADSMLARRPNGSGQEIESEFARLTQSAADGLINLHDPDTVVLWDFENTADSSPLAQKLRQMVSRDGYGWIGSPFQGLLSKQADRVSQIEKQHQAAEVQRAVEAKAVQAKADAEAATLRLEAERKARQEILFAVRRHPGLQSALSRLGLDNPQLDLTQFADLTPEQAQLAREIVAQYQQLSAGALITRTSETIVDSPGLFGLGRRTHQEIRHGLNYAVYDQLKKATETVGGGQVSLSSQAVLEALFLIHQKIYPPDQKNNP